MMAMFGNLNFPRGFIKEIRVESDAIEVTTLGSASRQFAQGPKRVTVVVEVSDLGTVEHIMTALGAEPKDAEPVSTALSALGVRKVRLDE